MKKLLSFLKNYWVFFILIGLGIIMVFATSGIFQKETISVMEFVKKVCKAENFGIYVLLVFLFLIVVLLLKLLEKIAKIKAYYNNMYEEKSREVEHLRTSNEKKDSTILNMNKLHNNILGRINKMQKSLKENTG